MINLGPLNIDYREAKQGDKTKILKLLNEEKTVISDEVWDWKYEQQPVKPYLTIGLNENKEIVVHGGSIVNNLIINREKFIGLKSEDIRVKKELRRKGIATKLLLDAKKRSEKKGIVLFGFPVPAAAKVASRIGLQNCGKIYNLVKLFPGKLKEKEYFEIKEIREFNNEFDVFWEKFGDLTEICILKDKKYLNWRFVKKPNNNYKIFAAFKEKKLISYIVCEKIGIRLRIEELVALDYNSVSSLINKCLEYYKGFIISITYHVSGKKMVLELKKMGFTKIPFFSHQLVLTTFPKEIEKSLITNVDNWFLTRADIEIRH